MTTPESSEDESRACRKNKHKTKKVSAAAGAAASAVGEPAADTQEPVRLNAATSATDLSKTVADAIQQVGQSLSTQTPDVVADDDEEGEASYLPEVSELID